MSCEAVVVLLFDCSSWGLEYEKIWVSWGLGECWRYFWGEYGISNEAADVDGGFRCNGDKCKDLNDRDLSLSSLCDDIWSGTNWLVDFYHIRMFCVLIFILLWYKHNKFLLHYNVSIYINLKRKKQSLKIQLWNDENNMNIKRDWLNHGMSLYDIYYQSNDLLTRMRRTNSYFS